MLFLCGDWPRLILGQIKIVIKGDINHDIEYALLIDLLWGISISACFVAPTPPIRGPGRVGSTAENSSRVLSNQPANKNIQAVASGHFFALRFHVTGPEFCTAGRIGTPIVAL